MAVLMSAAGVTPSNGRTVPAPDDAAAELRHQPISFECLRAWVTDTSYFLSTTNRPTPHTANYIHLNPKSPNLLPTVPRRHVEKKQHASHRAVGCKAPQP